MTDPTPEPGVPEPSSPKERPLHDLYRSREELCADARAAAESVTESMRQAFYLYYIARYLVAVFEARSLELPIQVWNEYRNAFDHFMRHLEVAGEQALLEQDGHHLSRMEGHVQRAVLDICKLLCTRTQDRIAEQVALWGKDCFELVGDGSLLMRVNAAREEAISLLESAKINDGALCGDADVNRAVVNRYLDAVFKYDHLYRLLTASANSLSAAKRRLEQFREGNEQTLSVLRQAAQDEMRGKALRWTLLVGVAASFIAGIPLAYLGWWLANRTCQTTTVSAPLSGQVGATDANKVTPSGSPPSP